MQAWNSNPWITQKYGTISPQNLAQKGEWTFLKFGEMAWYAGIRTVNSK